MKLLLRRGEVAFAEISGRTARRLSRPNGDRAALARGPAARLVPECVDGDRHLFVDLRADERRRRLGRLHEFAQ
jgi:hypothetical protein